MIASHFRSKSTVRALAAGAAVIFVAVVATSALKVTRYAKDGTDDAPEPVENTTTARPPKVQVEKIIAAHLFGSPQPKAKPVQQVVAPKTRLNLSLTGIIASDDPHVARAIIASGNRPAKSYAIGDVLEQSNVKLHAIKARMVLLDREGKLESLAIVRRSLKSSGLNLDKPDATPLPKPSANPARTTEPAVIPLIRERVKDLQQGLQQLGNGARQS